MAAWVLASFTEEERVAEAARELNRDGYQVEAYSPFPPASVYEALPGKERVALWVLLGAVSGVGIAFLFQWWCNALNYPINVGGRPTLSLPVYVPICFECAVLLGSFSGLYAFFVLCRLPKLHHELQSSALFERHTVDRFVLAVRWESESGPEPLQARLRALGAEELEEVLGT